MIDNNTDCSDLIKQYPLLKKIKVVNRGIDVIPYRIGDALLGINGGAIPLMERECHKGTIGHEFLKRTNRSTVMKNLDLFKEIVDTHTKQYSYELPLESDLVVHLRLGDQKVIAEQLVDKIISMIKSILVDKQIKRVIFVTALHLPKSLNENLVPKFTKMSYERMASLLELCKQLGVCVDIRSSLNIDSDLCFLCNAKHLMITVGGFSLLSAFYHRHNDTESVYFPSKMIMNTFKLLLERYKL